MVWESWVYLRAATFSSQLRVSLRIHQQGLSDMTDDHTNKRWSIHVHVENKRRERHGSNLSQKNPDPKVLKGQSTF